MKKKLLLLPFILAAIIPHVKGVIYSTVDRSTVDPATLSTLQPTGSWFYGAHEDNAGAGINIRKPIWHAGAFVTPVADKNVGVVSIPLQARVATALRLELYETDGTSAFANWKHLAKDVINTAAAGKQWFDFDLSAANILLKAGTRYAFNIVVDGVGGRWTAKSFDWLGSSGFKSTSGYESYFNGLPYNSTVPTASFGNYMSVSTGLGLNVEEKKVVPPTRGVPDASVNGCLALALSAMFYLRLRSRR